ncbi:LINE-1 retrotransposable element ORF1 protein [Dissostichus eleginoides]|uniref:LINE-1 retrotransposable element ORF1 protein n=1 Tax=Dissostichus eleginoides TaxID=100907 RepID=A0AAD9C023_DISEL|nr:LINE-1 retrotransposable element ORF1 protein [Dissostichus eleginoides]
MSKSSKKSPPKKGPETRGKSDMEALADTVLEKERGYLDSRFDQLQQMGRETEGKLTSIQTDLVVLSESICTVKAEMGKIRLDVVKNVGMLATPEVTLDMMQLKLEDMEDQSRRCNVRITGLADALEGSNAIRFLTKWFPSLSNLKGELMRAHRIYNDDRKKQKAPLTIDGRRIRFSPDYSSYTVKRCQAFSRAMDTARAKGVEFFLLYPATLKVKGAGQVKTFHSPGHAEDFIVSLPGVQDAPTGGDGDPGPGRSSDGE